MVVEVMDDVKRYFVHAENVTEEALRGGDNLQRILFAVGDAPKNGVGRKDGAMVLWQGVLFPVDVGCNAAFHAKNEHETV